MFDVLLKGGKVIDGTGNPWFIADVGIKDDRIARIGHLNEDASQVVDATGLVVSPGFIDIHTHSDLTPLIDPRCESKIRQGVTTEVIGNCGFSPAPLNPETAHYLKQSSGYPGIEWAWQRFADYLDILDKSPASVNRATLVGHGTIRTAVLGLSANAPDAKQLAKMKGQVAEALDVGAFGLSTGLIYAPNCYATTEEVIELARVLHKEDRLYATHIRGESDNLINAVDEAIRIGREAEVRVELAHHKASGMNNWGKVTQTLAMMEEARRAGLDVTCDVYPYPACSTDLAICVPPWVREDGAEELVRRINDPEMQEKIVQEMQTGESKGFWSSPIKNTGGDRIYVSKVNSPENKELEGRSLTEIAESRNKDVYTTIFEILSSEGGKVPCVYFEMSEADVVKVIPHPLAMIGSDGSSLSPEGVLGEGKPHPRNYGTFPRVLGKYVREDNVLTLQDAIRKMTSLPAQKVRLEKRGLLREGFFADIVVFDPDTVKDTATFQEPAQFPEGILYVIVNGQFVISDGQHTGATPGVVLRAT